MKTIYLILLSLLIDSCQIINQENQPPADNKIKILSIEKKEIPSENNLTESPLLKIKNQLDEFKILLDTGDLSFKHIIESPIIPKDMMINTITIYGRLPSINANDLWVDSLQLNIEEKSHTIIAPYEFLSCYCNQANDYDFFEYLLKFEDVDFDGIKELAINDTQGGGRHRLYNYYFLNANEKRYELNNIFTLPNLGIDPINKTYSATSSGGGRNYYTSKYVLEDDSLRLIYYEKQWDEKEMRAYVKETWDTLTIEMDTIYY